MHISGSRRRAGVAVAAVLPLLVGGVAAGIPAAAALPTGHVGARATLRGTAPDWATASADRGAAAGSSAVSARVYLAGRDEAGLERLARAVSDPSSASYRHFLTARQAARRFAPTRARTDAVEHWLASAGLTVTGATSHYVSVRGDVAAAEQAFGTRLRTYHRHGRTYRAPAADASVPAALASSVLTVTGLDDAPRREHHSAQPREELPPPGPAFVNAGPFSTSYGSRTATGTPSAYGTTEPYAARGYTGEQLRAAYGAAGTGLTGRGVTVAITDAYASPTIYDDAVTYASRTGDSPYAKGQFEQVTPGDYTHTGNGAQGCGAQGWYGEETLDVEAVHAVAPAAGITYVASASCYDDDLIDALSKVVDHHLADIVTNSWGEPENATTPALNAVYDRIFELGAVEGIGFYFSSGDTGDDVAATGVRQTDMPASSRWATAVGGTALGVGRHDRYLFETGWGTRNATLSADGRSWTGFPGAWTSGAGGGTSTTVHEPFYQRRAVPVGLSGAGGGRHRVVPDIAAVADPNTGFLVGQTQRFPGGRYRYGEYRIGGTSLASPVIAGIQALAQQASGGLPLGFANPAIYARYGTSAYHDVVDHPLGSGTDLAVVRVDYRNSVDASHGTVTSLRTLGHDASLSATRGYDDVTGVGTPTGAYLRSFGLGR